MCAFQAVYGCGFGNDYLVHSGFQSGKCVFQFGYHASLYGAVGHQRFELIATYAWDEAVIVVLVAQYAALFETESQCHFEVWSQRFGCLGSYGVGVGVQQMAFPVVGEGCHDGYYAFLYESGQQDA